MGVPRAALRQRYGLLWGLLAIWPAGLPIGVLSVAMFWGGFFASTWIEGYRFEVVPQFSHATGELCQVLFRAADADAERIARMSDLLTTCYGRPVEGETKRTWWGPGAAVELDTVWPSSLEEHLWLRWYPIPHAEGG